MTDGTAIRGTPGAPREPAVLVIIPARGGSKGIPRKNIRSLGGRPLLSYAIGTALGSEFEPDVVVTSDDDEILALAAKLGALTQQRAAELAEDATTLDAVIAGTYPEIAAATGRRYEIVVTLQPTSPLLRPASLDAAIRSLLADPALDTVLSAVDDTHLTWTRREGRFVPAYQARLNRQQLDPVYRETGGLILCRERVLLETGSRIGPNVTLQLVSGPEAIDIDTAEDWALCEWYLARRDVLFVVAGYPDIGLGHVHNALTIANELVRHRIRFLVTAPSGLAESVIAGHHYDVRRQAAGDLVAEILATGADVIVNDRLDTEADEILRLRDAGRTVINFEDLGEGARHADLVINAIYPERDALPHHHFGPRFFCIRNDFVLTEPRPVADEVRNVLLTFGGVDPNNATRRVLEAIAEACRERGIEISVIAGRGYRQLRSLTNVADARVDVAVGDMADRIRAADVVFTSAGRTVFEVAALGTPAIVVAQNERELTHFFASEEHGFRNLGLVGDVTDEAIQAAFIELVDSRALRERMHRRMLDNELRTGTARVVQLIEATIGGPWDSRS
jgi:CMP-N-acetylneuraminic acid synthetase/spore coat polysaccharide biosynthesis predicted glycosyltransferase SpsG